MHPKVCIDDDHVPGIEVAADLAGTHTRALWRGLQEPGLDPTNLGLPRLCIQIIVQVEVGAVSRGPQEDPHVANHVVLGQERGQRHQLGEGGQDGLLTHAPAHIPGLGAVADITGESLRRNPDSVPFTGEEKTLFSPEDVTEALELICFVALEEAVGSLVLENVF